MIMPVGAKNFREAMRIASEVYQSLKSLITKRYGSDSVVLLQISQIQMVIMQFILQ